MKYEDLIEEIQVRINHSDTQGLLRMITPENVATVFQYSSKPPVTGLAQQLTDHNWFASEYGKLKIELTAAATPAAAEQFFTPENVLIQLFGKDYEPVSVEAVVIATELGAPDPAAEAILIMQEATEERKINSNKQFA